MGRIVFAEEKLLPDLMHFVKFGGFVPGLIIGQSSVNKDFVVHLARTPLQSQSDLEVSESLENNEINSLAKLSDISESTIADHAKQVTRMLPGGMWILGVFIVGPTDIFGEPSSQSKLMSILTYIHRCLAKSPYLYGNSRTTEKLVFYLSSSTKKYSCRSVDIQCNSSISLKHVDWKFQRECTKWHQLDCYCDCEQIVPHIITKENSTYPVKKHLQEILSQVSNVVNKAICTIDGEIKDNSDSLEVTDKKKKGKQTPIKSNEKEEKVLEVNLYTPCELMCSGYNKLELINTTGEMRCNGSLSSRVFLHQKAIVEEAVKAVKEDIIRSFSSRLEMHWDSLVEEEIGSPDDRVVLHEPPRRVLIPLPHSKVALCDYLFPGEGASESLIALQELLGLNLTESAVQKDFEGQMDISQIYELTNTSESTAEDRSQCSISSSSYLLVGGIVIVIIIVLVSVLAQYVLTSKNIIK